MTLDITTISVLIGVIGGILGILNQLTNLRKQQEEVIKKQAVRDKDVEDRLGRIEERLNSHNSYASKFAELTEAIVEMKTDIKWIKEQK
jgi:uncharacterized HAD superfamily protein